MRNIALCITIITALLMSVHTYAAPLAGSPKQRVVVIDPGHGGPSRPGAVNGKHYEKSINLKVSLKVKQILGTING